MEPVELDFTSDSCSVFLSCDAEAAEALGWEVCGVSIEHAGDGYYYAAIGEAWDDDGWREAYPWPAYSEAELDTIKDRAAATWREAVEAEIKAAGLTWIEV